MSAPTTEAALFCVIAESSSAKAAIPASGSA
jgi:hypothetical protein